MFVIVCQILEKFEDTKGVFRRYQRGIQKIPKGYSEGINERTDNGQRKKRQKGKQ
jgi:hypothetical protein